MLYNVPIESLEERYSARWNIGFPEEFVRLGVNFHTIYPDIIAPDAGKITRGQFLDVIRTNEFKALQLAELMRLFDQGRIEDNDVILLHDLWFPGLEMLFYVRDGLGLKFKIAGLLHAGTYDPHDFLTQQGMERWAALIETSWWSEVDAVFVATHFHQQLLLNHRKDTLSVYVTGFPLFEKPQSVGPWEKQNLVVFPHRLAPEKAPEEFAEIAKQCTTRLPGWEFVRTKDVCNTKPEYYALLRQATIAVSCARQETWGIAQQEALFRGCLPIVPDRLSYQELYDEVFRYQTLSQAADMIVDFAQHPGAVARCSEFNATVNRCEVLSSKAVPEMVKIMRDKGWAV